MPSRLEHTTATASYRRASEDRSAIASPSGGTLIILADGAGGMTGGAVAAEMVVATLANVATSPADPDALVGLMVALDQRIADAPDAGQTTAVIAVVDHEGRIFGASAGDSEAWLIDETLLDDLTHGQQRRLRLGSGRAEPTGFARPSMRRGTLLIASDGLFAFTSRDAIATAIRRGRELDEAARALVDQVRPPSGKFADDVTVILARQRRDK